LIDQKEVLVKYCLFFFLIKGPKGDQGSPGLAGVNGLNGDVGIQGPPGLPVSFSLLYINSFKELSISIIQLLVIRV
jgi:hypothetical protein